MARWGRGRRDTLRSNLSLTPRRTPLILRKRSADRSSPILFVMRPQTPFRCFVILGPLALLTAACATTGTGAPDASPAAVPQGESTSAARPATTDPAAGEQG